MKKIISFIAVISMLLPCIADAKSIGSYEVISYNEKYFKTNYYFNNTNLMSTHSANNYTTIEITKEEYESFNNTNFSVNETSVETTYKKLTTYILKSGSNYRYKTVLSWKNFPKVRSYDIIGIGFYSSVKVKGNLFFTQDYCVKNDGCRSTSTHYPQTFSNGAGASFKLPESDLTSLSQTLYFDVEKNTDANIIKQIAAGDYSHAIKTVSVSQGMDYTVNSLGISILGTNANNYDSISSATTTWNGNW